MGDRDQFAKDLFARETEMLTQHAVTWQCPPEVGTTELHLDGLMLVHDLGPLATLAAPWCLLREPGELGLEIKMQGDARGLRPFDRACLRRYARLVQRREDPKERFKGELPFWFVASTMPPVIRKRRSPEPIAPGCYRIGPEWFATTWVCTNELPLAEELMPFLVSRTGPALDEFVRWVMDRRPPFWLEDVLQWLPMSAAAFQELHARVYVKTANPEILERRRLIVAKLLEEQPEMRAQIEVAGELRDARAALCDVLDARGLALGAGDKARIDACADLGTLRRWHRQAVVANSVADALR